VKKTALLAQKVGQNVPHAKPAGIVTARLFAWWRLQLWVIV